MNNIGDWLREVFGFLFFFIPGWIELKVGAYLGPASILIPIVWAFVLLALLTWGFTFFSYNTQKTSDKLKPRSSPLNTLAFWAVVLVIASLYIGYDGDPSLLRTDIQGTLSQLGGVVRIGPIPTPQVVEPISDFPDLPLDFTGSTTQTAGIFIHDGSYHQAPIEGTKEAFLELTGLAINRKLNDLHQNQIPYSETDLNYANDLVRLWEYTNAAKTQTYSQTLELIGLQRWGTEFQTVNSEPEFNIQTMKLISQLRSLRLQETSTFESLSLTQKEKNVEIDRILKAKTLLTAELETLQEWGILKGYSVESITAVLSVDRPENNSVVTDVPETTFGRTVRTVGISLFVLAGVFILLAAVRWIKP